MTYGISSIATMFADEKIKDLELKLFLKLLDKHRSNNNNYDCIVPGSGGKDSCYAAHILKFKYEQ